MPTVYHRVDSTCSLSDILFTANNVEAAIKRLKSNLSSGPDELPPLLFKKLGLVIAQPLAILYHQLFSVSFIPPEWKHAVITPVFKKGLSSSVSNYRPISLTCVTSKIMERIISDQMHSYVLSNGLINEAQHGFLRGLSTTTNLLHCVNDWSLTLHNRHGVTIVYIDLAKAFDTVLHEKLLYRDLT